MAYNIMKLGEYVQGASVSAMNRAASTTVTAASKFIRERYQIKKETLDKNIKILHMAQPGLSFVEVGFSQNELSLMVFGARQIGLGGRPRKAWGDKRVKSGTYKNFKLKVTKTQNSNTGVKASVIKGSPKLYRSGDNLRGSFIAKMQSGHMGVFIRDSSRRLKIHELFGVSITRLVQAHDGNKVYDLMKNTFTDAYSKRLEHELKRRSITNIKYSE